MLFVKVFTGSHLNSNFLGPVFCYTILLLKFDALWGHIEAKKDFIPPGTLMFFTVFANYC